MNTPIFYLCNDPERALGIEDLIPNFHIVCIDNTPIIPILRERGIKIFSVAEKNSNPNPLFRSSQRLLQNKDVIQYIKQNTPEDSTPYIMLFKPSPRIEKLATQLGYRVLNPESRLNRLFENKISQYNILSKIGLNFPKTLIGKLDGFDYPTITKQLSSQLVIQFNRGHTGDSTYFISTEAEFNNLKQTFPFRLCRIAQKIDGEAWTINCCTTKFGTIAHGLSYQITGVEDLTTQKGGTVGNDWSRSIALTEQVREKIKEVCVKTGDEMYKAGFKGMFGIDLIIDPHHAVYIIEVNARQPASTSTHAKLMRELALPPLQAFHIYENLESADKIEFYQLMLKHSFDLGKSSADHIRERACEPINASQIFIRNLNKIKTESKSILNAGVYDGTHFIRPEYDISKISENEVLLLLVGKGQLISTNSEIGRIQARVSLTQNRHLFEPFVKLIRND